MVNKILKFINKEFSSVNEAALLLGFFAFISQLLGLVRDRTLAHIVGAGPILDVYYAAFRIPDFLYISIASLFSVTVLMPFVINKIDKDNNVDARKFLNNIFSAYIVFMVFIMIIIALIIPYLVKYIAPGFDNEQIRLLIVTSRIMLLSPVFIGLSNLFGTITQLYKNFFIFSLSPIFYNLGIIFGIVYFYEIFGVYGLAYGVSLGAILHLLIQIPSIIKYKFLPSINFKINWVEIWLVIKSSAPRTLTLSANSLAFIFLISMASQIKEGSISLFTFAYNLQSVPVGIIGISYSVAAFPILTKYFSLKEVNKFIEQILFTSKQIIFWSFPVITLMIVLRAQIVRVILGTNAFSWYDTRLTAASVSLFVLSLVSQSLVLLFVRGYYASGNTKKPLIVNIFSSLMVIFFAHILLSIFKTFPLILLKLEILLRVSDVPGTMMLALPFAYALGSILNFFLIWFLFKKDFLLNIKTDIFKTFYQSLISSIFMGLITYISLGFFDNIFNLSRGLGIFMQGFISGLLGIISGVFVLYIFRNDELLLLIKILRNKFKNKSIIIQEQIEL